MARPDNATNNATNNATDNWAGGITPSDSWQPSRTKAGRVAAVIAKPLFNGRAKTQTLLGADYLRATHQATHRWLALVTANELEKVIDERWDPPVTLGVRLVSILEDDAQHLGQANLVRGILERS